MTVDGQIGGVAPADIDELEGDFPDSGGGRAAVAVEIEATLEVPVGYRPGTTLTARLPDGRLLQLGSMPDTVRDGELLVFTIPPKPSAL